MDAIREHLTYKNTPFVICMGKLTPQEQYECIRIILESKSPVKICTHDATNECVTLLLKELPVQFVQCWAEEEVLVPVADLLQ